MKNFGYIAIVLFLLWAFKKLKAAKGLNFDIVGVRTVGDLFSAKIILDTNVNNPTEQGVYLDYIIADVNLGGKKVGKINYTQRILLQPGLNKIEIPVLLNPLVTAGIVFDAIKAKNSFKVITLEGEISFEGIKTTYSEEFELFKNA